jgi:hypothetical protein
MRRLPSVRVPGYFNTWPSMVVEFADRPRCLGRHTEFWDQYVLAREFKRTETGDAGLHGGMSIGPGSPEGLQNTGRNKPTISKCLGGILPGRLRGTGAELDIARRVV